MRVEIDLRKSAGENAAIYFQQSKKFRKKLEGLGRGIEELSKKAEAEKVAAAPSKPLLRKRERKWYEKHHWFFTSEGFLVVAGRDAHGNEAIVNKLMHHGDLFFHADIPGAAHTILKAAGGLPGEQSRKEAAAFAAVFSSAWRDKLPAVDVYSASPEQVTKAAPSGESIGAGAFMVYGKREWYRKMPLEFAVGFRAKNGEVALHSGPPSAVRANSDFFLYVSSGNDPKGDAAKKILKIFSLKLGDRYAINLDDIVALLPSGGISVAFSRGK